MKFITYETENGLRIGAMSAANEVLDLAAAAAALEWNQAPWSSMQTLIDAGAPALAQAMAMLAKAHEVRLRDAHRRLGDLSLRAPLPVPQQIRDCLSFEAHLKNSLDQTLDHFIREADDSSAARAHLLASGRFTIPAVWYERPIYYKANRFAVIGPDQEVEWPRYAKKLDYELEFAVVIGRKGRDIAAEHARSHIFGYTIFNDFSARDTQLQETAGGLGPAKGKDFDTANAFGPCIVTPDEIGDPYSLSMIARVNGEERCHASTSSMHHRFEEIIAFISQSETLYPGEIIGSGTVGGGSGLESGRYLKVGDVVELEVERIGVLRNRLVHPPKAQAGHNL